MTLYAGTYSNGIYKTTDAGGTWVSIGPNDTTVWEIAIDPTTPTTLYAAADSGVFKSTNGGASWDPTALMNTPLQALAIDPTEPTTLYAGGGGVFKSTDGGGTWRSTGLMGDETVAVSVYELAIDLITPATLYAGAIVANCSPFGCGRGGRYLGKTTDGGDTWTVTPGPAHVPALTIDPTAPMTLYAVAPAYPRAPTAAAPGRRSIPGSSTRTFARLPSIPSRRVECTPQRPTVCLPSSKSERAWATALSMAA